MIYYSYKNQITLIKIKKSVCMCGVWGKIPHIGDLLFYVNQKGINQTWCVFLNSVSSILSPK